MKSDPDLAESLRWRGCEALSGVRNRRSEVQGATLARESSGEGMMSLPIVCTLTPDAMATRKAALLTGLVSRAEGRQETADGLRFKFPADALSALVAAIEAERQCCRFLRFEIAIEPDGGPIWLSLTGPQGTREFLAALIET